MTETQPPPVTRWLASRAAAMQFDDLPAAAVTIARRCLLDWFTIAGGSEPAVGILRDELLADAAAPPVSFREGCAMADLMALARRMQH